MSARIRWWATNYTGTMCLLSHLTCIGSEVVRPLILVGKCLTVLQVTFNVMIVVSAARVAWTIFRRKSIPMKRMRSLLVSSGKL